MLEKNVRIENYVNKKNDLEISQEKEVPFVLLCEFVPKLQRKAKELLVVLSNSQKGCLSFVIHVIREEETKINAALMRQARPHRINTQIKEILLSSAPVLERSCNTTSFLD